jgi:hypothetical protein
VWTTIELEAAGDPMAKYKYPHHMIQSDVTAFDKDWLPGQITLNAGIYRCRTCGDEIVVGRRQQIPTAHHEHAVLGPVVWQLLVFAQEHPK